ncbi:unnamed protein product [Pylaiella littoralis]
MSAHFSAVYEQSSGLVQWSPDGRYVATAVGQRVVVRDAKDSFEIVQGGLRPCLDKIESLEWAADSDLLLCAMFKRSLVEVMSVARPDWQCRIREGMAGMVKALWAPDARHVVTFSDFNLHMSVWSLSTRQMHTVRQPKAAPGCIAFSPDTLIMAVATRRDCRDNVKLYNTTTWESLGEFTAETVDLVAVEFSPDGFTLCLQDTSLEYRVLFYSLEGKLVGRLEAYSHALGVKSLSWSPDGTLLSVGSYDQCVRLVSPVTWKPVAVLRHVQPKTLPGFEKVACYREVPVGQEHDDDDDAEKAGDEDAADNNKENGGIEATFRAPSHGPSLSVMLPRAGGVSGRSSVSGRKGVMGARRPAAGSTLKPKISSKDVEITYAAALRGAIPSEKPDPSRPNPKLGVGQIISWSADGRYLATRNDNMASALWVWDAQDLSLSSVVVQMESVRSAKWCPNRHTLAICTANHHVYFWSPEGASWVDVPSEGLEILGFRWSPDGDALLLLSKDKVCCCNLSEPDAGDDEEMSAEGGDREEEDRSGVSPTGQGEDEGGVVLRGRRQL